jgi:hypothetical protein
VLTISFSFQPADDVPTTTNAAAPSGEGQGDKGKANVETSEASMPPKPKKKKKKAKSKSRPSGEQEKDGESPIPTIPVENQPPHVENPSTENHAPSQEKISSSSQNPGAQVKYLLHLLRLCEMNIFSL